MCPSEATTDEHVPPACIFPEKKDLPRGLDLRKNLITVPSCPDHNLRKSGDDEYLLYVITSNISTNPFAQLQWATKIKRSYGRRPSKLRMFGGLFPVRILEHQTGGFYLDKPRIDSELERVARGLYFHGFGQHWEHPVEIVSPSFVSLEGGNAAAYNLHIAKLNAFVARYLQNDPWRGDNPEVFKYQVQRNDNPTGLVLRMLFYGHFEITAYSIPSIPDNNGDA
jgi:hypothetical protein